MVNCLSALAGAHTVGQVSTVKVPATVSKAIEHVGGIVLDCRLSNCFLKGDFGGIGKTDYAVLVTQRDTKSRGILLVFASGGTAQGAQSQRGVPMGFSFADLEFWRLAVVAFIFELAHGLLESHWPGIRGSRLGPRPLEAVLFMFAEAVAVGGALAAAIATVARSMKLPVHPVGKISAVVVAALSLIGVFCLSGRASALYDVCGPTPGVWPRSVAFADRA